MIGPRIMSNEKFPPKDYFTPSIDSCMNTPKGAFSNFDKISDLLMPQLCPSSDQKVQDYKLRITNLNVQKQESGSSLGETNTPAFNFHEANEEYFPYNFKKVLVQQNSAKLSQRPDNDTFGQQNKELRKRISKSFIEEVDSLKIASESGSSLLFVNEIEALKSNTSIGKFLDSFTQFKSRFYNFIGSINEVVKCVAIFKAWVLS